ncbi:ubiquitin ligase (Hul4) [Fusarium heterosporum]|uniref:Ubiquitin ligase (Hul4) n=1 Tax=Fusarium heterosporum TaxID=42747 RepID=A0A8H5WK44_FUSHE|nr:ubiquitin ligase (Hul4) [Fusarium heterosporum]
MLISNSPLFKEYARPVIQSESSRGRALYSPFVVMDTVVQRLLNLAKLETTQFKISNVSKDSFDLTIESRLIGTGIISSTIHATDVNLSFNGYNSGKMMLPQIQTSFWGTKLVVWEQRVYITNHTVCHAFVRSLIVDDNTSLQLESKRCTVGALGTSSTCDLHLDIPLKAMGRLHVTLKKLLRADKSITTGFNLNYTGPIEIDYGHCLFEFGNGSSETLLEMRGDLKMAQS